MYVSGRLERAFLSEFSSDFLEYFTLVKNKLLKAMRDTPVNAAPIMAVSFQKP